MILWVLNYGTNYMQLFTMLNQLIFLSTIKSMFISLYDWCGGMFVILFTVQIQLIWYNIHNNMLIIATVINLFKIRLVWICCCFIKI